MGLGASPGVVVHEVLPGDGLGLGSDSERGLAETTQQRHAAVEGHGSSSRKEQKMEAAAADAVAGCRGAAWSLTAGTPGSWWSSWWSPPTEEAARGEGTGRREHHSLARCGGGDGAACGAGWRHGRREHELGEEAERWRGGGGGRLMRTGAVHRGAEEATRGRTRGGEEASRRRGARRSGGHGLGEEG